MALICRDFDRKLAPIPELNQTDFGPEKESERDLDPGQASEKEELKFCGNGLTVGQDLENVSMLTMKWGGEKEKVRGRKSETEKRME